jgi:cell division protein FtsQ
VTVIVVVTAILPRPCSGRAEMKKKSSKRASGLEPGFDYGYDSGTGSAVLDAPEESFALKGARVDDFGWQGREPAPAGSLQRGYGAADEPGYGRSEFDEPEYVPRRGSGFRMRFWGIPKSVAGRIVLGVVVFSAVSAVAIAVGVARYYVLHDERFVLATSSDVEIRGDAHLARMDVLGVFAGDLQRNIFRIPLAERRADLERLPWVEHATVMRLLPDKIRVQITERTPVAFVRQGSQIGLVDGSGVLLDMPPESAGDPHYSFPVLTGLSASDPLSTRAARVGVYRQFMKELDSTGERLTNSLSEVDVSNPEDVKALIASGNSDILVHFGEAQYLNRYREFEKHLPEWKLQYPKLASADMRYEGQIVLEMQNGVPVPAAGVDVAAGAAPAIAKPMAIAPAVIAPAAKETPKPTTVTAKKLVKPVAKPAIAKKSKPATKGKAKVARKGAAGKSASNEKIFAELKAKSQAKFAAAKGGTKP